jgi:hypothetical protein
VNSVGLAMILFLSFSKLIQSYIHSFIHVLWHLQGIQDALDFYIYPLINDL